MFRFELILILTLLNSLFLNAASYDEDILNIYSKMLPRLVIMSSQKDKIKNSIEICVLHDKLDEMVAQSLISKIEAVYPNGLKNYPIKLIQSSYNNFESCNNVQAVFMFNTDEKHIQKANIFLQKNSILSVSYDMVLLEQGADISLFIGRKVMPYVNIKAIIDKKIVLDNLLVRVSKIYVKSDK